MAAPDRTELAENRTDLAEDRTVLAHERSFAGWVRTGLTAVGIGLGFNALFATMHPAWLPKTIATGFLLVAIYIFISADRRARSIIGKLEAHKINDLKPVKIRLLALALVGATIALVGALWFFTAV